MDSGRALPYRSGLRSRGPLVCALAALGVAAVLAAPLRALGEEPAPSKVPSSDDEEGPEAGKARPAAPDTRFGHLLISPRVDWTAPVGWFTSLAAASDITRPGMSFGGSLGLGLGRYVAVEATGSYSLFLGLADCSACKGHSFDLGLGFSYHLAQGVAIDPWGSFGVGFRMATFKTLIDAEGQNLDGATDQSYRGLDFARIALGADFYPLPALGFGPYIEADVGTNVGQPPPTGGLAAYAFFHLGLRIALDPFRSGSPRARATVGRR